MPNLQELLDGAPFGGEVALPSGVFSLSPGFSWGNISSNVSEILEHNNGHSIEGVFGNAQGYGELLSKFSVITSAVKDKGKIIGSEILAKNSRPEWPLPSGKTGKLLKQLLSNLPASSPAPENIWKEEISITQRDYIAGEVVLNYFPFSVDFRSELIQAKNLYTGELSQDTRFDPALDGFATLVTKSEIKSIARWFWLAKHGGLIGKPDMSRSGLLKATHKIVIREALSIPWPGAEMWYYPVFQVPITLICEASAPQQTVYATSPTEFIRENYMHKVIIETRGDILFDGMDGHEISRSQVDYYFRKEDRASQEPNYNIEFLNAERIELPTPALLEPIRLNHKLGWGAMGLPGIGLGMATGNPLYFLGVGFGGAVLGVGLSLLTEKLMTKSRNSAKQADYERNVKKAISELTNGAYRPGTKG